MEAADLLLVLSVILFAAMLALALWGAKVIRPEARFRARLGVTGVDGTIGRRAGLVAWPLIGLFVLLGGVLSSSARWLAVLILVFLLFMQYVSISSTARL
ncbi:MAG: hypothetical protein M3280_00880 [Actinomycetota bacterium]|nr:hypothetical protein [Actinomycetota bacterium]